MVTNATAKAITLMCSGAMLKTESSRAANTGLNFMAPKIPEQQRRKGGNHMDQALFETPVKSKKQRNKKYNVKDIHAVALKSHKLTEFFGNTIMF